MENTNSLSALLRALKADSITTDQLLAKMKEGVSKNDNDTTSVKMAKELGFYKAMTEMLLIEIKYS